MFSSGTDMLSHDPLAPKPEDQREALEWLGPDCIDVGCGPNPLPKAKYLYDIRDWGDARIIVKDFYWEWIEPRNVYCRHVLEDLRYPEALFKMFACCEKGWIETPSPALEVTRGVDCGPSWRGFSHHYWFVWSQDGILHFLPKSNNVEYIEFRIEPTTGNITKWTTYYKWDNYQFKYKIYQHGIDFDFRDNSYIQLLQRGLNA